jgi:hypothetical protein
VTSQTRLAQTAGFSITANPAGAQPRSHAGQPNLPSRLDRGEHRHIIHSGKTPPNQRSTTCYTDTLTSSASFTAA